MANKLKNLRVTSVDLVPLGANPDANIKLFKSRTIKRKDDNVDTFWKKIQKAFLKNTGVELSDEVMKEIESSIDTNSNSPINDITKAMNESLESIKEDVNLSDEEKINLIHKSLGECMEFIEKSKQGKNTQNTEKPKEDSKMDVIKMNPDDKKTYEEFIKKYNLDKLDFNGNERSITDNTKSTETNPEVKKALDEISQLKKELEMRDLEGIAKQYEILGKKPKELAPKLYELKKAGGTAYNDYISILDEMKTAYQTSGIFKEIGSNMSGNTSINGKLEAAVAEIKKASPNISTPEAIVKACDENPELKAMYESM